MHSVNLNLLAESICFIDRNYIKSQTEFTFEVFNIESFESNQNLWSRILDWDHWLSKSQGVACKLSLFASFLFQFWFWWFLLPLICLLSLSNFVHNPCIFSLWLSNFYIETINGQIEWTFDQFQFVNTIFHHFFSLSFYLRNEKETNIVLHNLCSVIFDDHNINEIFGWNRMFL